MSTHARYINSPTPTAHWWICHGHHQSVFERHDGSSLLFWLFEFNVIFLIFGEINKVRRILKKHVFAAKNSHTTMCGHFFRCLFFCEESEEARRGTTNRHTPTEDERGWRHHYLWMSLLNASVLLMCTQPTLSPPLTPSLHFYHSSLSFLFDIMLIN